MFCVEARADRVGDGGVSFNARLVAGDQSNSILVDGMRGEGGFARDYNIFLLFFFSSRRRHTRYIGDWSSDVCSSDLPLDRDMVRVEVQRLEAERSLQVGAVERRFVELERLLGMGADASLTLRTALEDLVREEVTPGASVPQSDTLTTRPDVLEAEARVRVAEAQIDRAHREGRPDMSLFGMYMRTDAGFPQQGFSPSGALEPIRSVFHYVSIGAMVTLPVMSRNQGAVAAAEAERTGAAAQVEAVRLSAQSEIAAARSRDEHARRALDAYSADAIALAQHNLLAVRQTYELGRGTLLDVLNEQRRYLDVERAYTDVLREAYEARETLKTALGEIR